MENYNEEELNILEELAFEIDSSCQDSNILEKSYKKMLKEIQEVWHYATK